jgi:hypothetical protein
VAQDGSIFACPIEGVWPRMDRFVFALLIAIDIRFRRNVIFMSAECD